MVCREKKSNRSRSAICLHLAIIINSCLNSPLCRETTVFFLENELVICCNAEE